MLNGAQLVEVFLLGLATPLSALCVIPLFPSFISYMVKNFQDSPGRKTYALFGLLVVAGVMSFMLIIGLVFATFLQSSITGVVNIVSPIAFVLLGIAGIYMLLGNEIGFGNFSPPEFENPLANAFAFGFSFGAIVIPCNPSFIAVFFARSFLFSDPVSSIANFGLFGLGMGFPLLLFSLVSASKSQAIISFLTGHRKAVDRISGGVMLGVSIYYLFFVFEVLPI